MPAFAVAKPVAAMQTRVAALRSKVRRAQPHSSSRNRGIRVLPQAPSARLFAARPMRTGRRSVVTYAVVRW